jgi:hypothetical protein
LDYKFEEKPQFRFYKVMTVKKLLHGSGTWVSREREGYEESSGRSKAISRVKRME